MKTSTKPTLRPERRLIYLAALLGVTVAAIVMPNIRAGDLDAPAAEPVAAVDPAPAADTEPLIKASQLVQHTRPNALALRSGVALVMDAREGVVLYERAADTRRPIASLTKIMTALATLEAGLPLDEPIEVTRADRDRLRGTGSRIPFGAVVTRLELLHAALAASDNRAAAALARSYPGGTPAFIAAMNAKARSLGMAHTRFTDASGLSDGNVSTARDLVKLATAANAYPLIHELTTSTQFSVTDRHAGRDIEFLNTNRLVRGDRWDIELSKTGYTAAAGNCLIMQTTIGERPVLIVLLNSWGKLSRYGDSQRIHDWLLRGERRALESLDTVAGVQG
jgi:serine-type D-Ala-D-Ala endopeptidase (penicillin-binding protein 7)